jgi:hypothetical protein
VKAADEAELVSGVGKAVMRVLAGKVVKGDIQHGVTSKGGKVGADAHGIIQLIESVRHTATMSTANTVYGTKTAVYAVR